MQERTETGAVALELLNAGLRIKGLLGVPGTKRVSDLLNDPIIEVLTLRDVRLETIEGTLLDTMAEFIVEKASIVVAIPWESVEYLAARRIARFGVSRPQQSEMVVRVAVPPFVARGQLHLAPSAGAARILVSLGRFIALTDGVVELNQLVVGEAPTVILNSDFVLGIGRTEDKSNAARSSEVRQFAHEDASQVR